MARRSLRSSCLVVVLAIALAGCATPHGPSCHADEQPAVHVLLYFGTSRTEGVVTQDEWTAFLATSVTPRFPQGLTVWDAAGQWRTTDGKIIREVSHVLSVVHLDVAHDQQAMVEIIAAYKARFHQEAVLRVRSVACMSL